MRTLAILISLFISQYLSAQNTITVSVPDIPTNKGLVMFGLYSEGNFMKAAPDFSAKSKIENKTATVVFEGIPDGEYAVAVYQDENENQRLDFAANGMPAENFGFSNNPVLMGPPQWSQAKFELAGEPMELEIIFL